MSSLKGRGNSSERIEEHIDYISNQIPVDDSCMPAVRPSTPAYPVNGILNSPDRLISCTLNSLHPHDSKLNSSSDKNEVQIPSELITHCVATLLMIQVTLRDAFPGFIYLCCFWQRSDIFRSTCINIEIIYICTCILETHMQGTCSLYC